MTMIFQSDAMQNVMAQAMLFARASATILVVGESGTGKELLARFLHDHSSRAVHPCVRINCAAFNEGLVESELFGHEAGAFTGALRRHEGCIHAAGDGTLFLDEIGELPLSTQAKLLRVLEENEYLRVGSTALQQMRARVIAATNRDLESLVRTGRFREDLFHRLNVLTLRVPALRERPADIPLLVSHFVAQFSRDGGSPATRVADHVMQQLLNYRWPGNIRQLRNVIQRACIVADSEVIQSVDFGAASGASQAQSEDLTIASFDGMSLAEIERHVILRRLAHFGGNREDAAAELGITSRTLRNKLALYREMNEIRKAG